MIFSALKMVQLCMNFINIAQYLWSTKVVLLEKLKSAAVIKTFHCNYFWNPQPRILKENHVNMQINSKRNCKIMMQRIFNCIELYSYDAKWVERRDGRCFTCRIDKLQTQLIKGAPLNIHLLSPVFTLSLMLPFSSATHRLQEQNKQKKENSESTSGT